MRSRRGSRQLRDHNVNVVEKEALLDLVNFVYLGDKGDLVELFRIIYLVDSVDLIDLVDLER